MPTSEDYRQMANRAAKIAIACSAPSVAAALLALALSTWRSLMDSVGQPLRKNSGSKKCSKILRATEIRPRPVSKCAPQTGRVGA